MSSYSQKSIFLKIFGVNLEAKNTMNLEAKNTKNRSIFNRNQHPKSDNIYIKPISVMVDADPSDRYGLEKLISKAA